MANEKRLIDNGVRVEEKRATSDDVREKLVGLIAEAKRQWEGGTNNLDARIADYLIANGVTVQEWISVKERLPSEGEWLSSEACSFLCKVLIPIPGGSANNKQQVIGYDRLHRRWACEDMIVTHWMPLPKGE